MTFDALIEIRDLSRRDAKSNRLLFDCVDLTIRAGERIGLTGPTGSGKSSLLRAIARLDHCQSGDVLYRGQRISNDDVPGYRRRVVYLPQRPSFVPGTVRQNLQLPFRLAASDGEFNEQRAIDRLGQFARSASMLDQSVDNLSGGEQQIVALIRAIALSPAVLLLDEPTASLDVETREPFERLVLDWHNEGDEGSASARALVWTSHDDPQIRRMTTRIATMREGVLAMENRDD